MRVSDIIKFIQGSLGSVFALYEVPIEVTFNHQLVRIYFPETKEMFIINVTKVEQ